MGQPSVATLTPQTEALPPLVRVPSPHLEHSISSSCPQRDDILRYMEGYFPDHIAIILSLAKCPPSDSSDYLEDSKDYDSDKMGCDETPSDDQVGD
ncbi:UNVERIFIED_CONTAM: hypothetical protein Sradi_6858200 [Sesamum radiatum]|uniref:Uncharacterized protein n=1 Tax=Sesamum radiatum TaxID=300843 RepID=A0AAW2JLM3_SESRA